MALLTIEQVSDLLKVKPSWLRWHVFKRNIPYVKVGRHIRFEPNEIQKWIDERRFAKGGVQ